MLIDAAEDRGPTLFARMGIVRALETPVSTTLTAEGQGPSQDRAHGKLKGDRDVSI
jgi:hypothetical protein